MAEGAPAGRFSDPGRHAAALGALPADPAALCRIVQGLVLHEQLGPLHGVAIPAERRAEVHIRALDEMLDRMLELDPASLDVARPPLRRLVGSCRDYALLLIAMLRAQGCEARARCGFAGYFEPGRHVDHWVAEWRRPGGHRWTRLDAELDPAAIAAFAIDLDPLDVPVDRFLDAGTAWTLARAGALDPDGFGIAGMSGYWFMTGNLLRDLAALNGVEMLPWDCWGAMAADFETLDAARLARFDRLAAIVRGTAPDLAACRAAYAEPGMPVPATVRNAVRGRDEAI